MTAPRHTVVVAGIRGLRQRVVPNRACNGKIANGAKKGVWRQAGANNANKGAAPELEPNMGYGKLGLDEGFKREEGKSLCRPRLFVAGAAELDRRGRSDFFFLRGEEPVPVTAFCGRRGGA